MGFSYLGVIKLGEKKIAYRFSSLFKKSYNTTIFGSCCIINHEWNRELFPWLQILIRLQLITLIGLCTPRKFDQDCLILVHEYIEVFSPPFFKVSWICDTFSSNLAKFYLIYVNLVSHKPSTNFCLRLNLSTYYNSM